MFLDFYYGESFLGSYFWEEEDDKAGLMEVLEVEAFQFIPSFYILLLAMEIPKSLMS